MAMLSGPTSWAEPRGAPDSTVSERLALPSTGAPRPVSLFGRRDGLFALAGIGAVAIAAPQDVWLTHESDESRAPAERTVARLAQPLGNGAVVLPLLATGWLAARASGRTAAADAFVRTGVSVGAAGASALLLKELVGRPRPTQSPGDSDDLRPFSGHASFPSGHTTVAFALAAAINRESSWRPTPWVTYPLALLVGWSRVHDDAHWTSDVVAGMALGVWTANKAEGMLHRAPIRASRIHFGIRSLDGAPAVGFTLGG
jgi:membrane-associated phospholipid phosphatase